MKSTTYIVRASGFGLQDLTGDNRIPEGAKLWVRDRWKNANNDWVLTLFCDDTGVSYLMRETQFDDHYKRGDIYNPETHRPVFGGLAEI